MLDISEEIRSFRAVMHPLPKTHGASSIGRTLVSADRSDHWQQPVERLRGYPNHWSRPTGLGGDWWIVLACIRAKKFWSMPGPAVSVTLPYMVILPADIGNAPSR